MQVHQEETVLQFFSQSSLFARMIRDGFRSIDRFPGEFFLLRTICESANGRVTPSQASRLTGMRPPTLSPVAGRLEDQGLLVRVPSRSDRRRIYLEVTPQGIQVYRQAQEALMDFYRGMAAALTPEELGTLLPLLQKLTHAHPSNSPKEVCP